MRRALVRAPGFDLGRLIAALALVIVAVPVAIYGWTAVQRIGYPYELNWLEGGTVELAGRVLDGQSLYSAPSLGYAGFTYTPLFSILSAAVAELTGLGFEPLRIVSFASSLTSLTVLAFYVRDMTGDWVAGAVAAGLFAAMYGLTGWFFDVGRGDSMFLCVSLLTLWLGRRGDSLGAGVAIGALGFLAFFTKQVGLIVVAPALVCAVLARPRAGVGALGTLLVLTGGSTLLLDAVTHNWYRYYIEGELAGHPLVVKNEVGFWRLSLYHHLHWLTLSAGLGALVPGGRVGLERLRARRGPAGLGTGALESTGRRSPARMAGLRNPLLYDLAGAGGLLVAAWVSFLHSGGYLNVLMPGYAAAAGLGGWAFGMLRARGALGAIIATALLGLQVHTLVEHEHASRALPRPGQVTAGNELIRRLAALPGPVLVLRHPWYGTLAGQGAFAQSDGITEILRSADPRGRRTLARALTGSLNRYHIQAVVLDELPAQSWLARQLKADFHRVRRAFPEVPLHPPADIGTAPTYLFLRDTR